LKVLWFSLSPGLSDVYLNDSYTGFGWMKALEKNMRDKVDLSIAFYYDKEVAPFMLDGTRYIPIGKYKSGKVSKIKQRLSSSTEPNFDKSLFLKIINEVKPDLIHIHGTESNYGLLQKFTSIPAVVSIQSVITVYKYKYFSTISQADVRKHSTLKDSLFLRTYNHIYKMFVKRADREQEIYRHTKNIIGRTAWDRRVTSVLVPTAAYYHNDEILRDPFYKHLWSAPASQKLILFTTNGPDIYKGIETLIDCAWLLDQNQIDYEWQVAGLTANDETVKIAAKTVGKSISANIKFLGNLNENVLVQTLLKTHIYISVSHIENSPNSLCEAQILGLPCIATFAGGTNSLLEDSKDGILIQDADPYAMAGAILELKNNFAKAITFGQNARTKALLRHNPDKITTDLLMIYNKILPAT
jgi:glycosyltransferase involved in cell wall biosynthesis